MAVQKQQNIFPYFFSLFICESTSITIYLLVSVILHMELSVVLLKTQDHTVVSRNQVTSSFTSGQV